MMHVFRYTRKTRRLIPVTKPQHRDLITREYRGRYTNYLPVSMSMCYYHDNRDLTGSRHYGILLNLDSNGLSIFADGVTPTDFKCCSIRELSQKILKCPWHFCDANEDGYLVNIISGRWEDEEE